MRKRAKKLSLCTETLRTLSAPALTRAVGGAVEVMTGDPTDCICPGPLALVEVMTGDPTDCICPRPAGFRIGPAVRRRF